VELYFRLYQMVAAATCLAKPRLSVSRKLPVLIRVDLNGCLGAIFGYAYGSLNSSSCLSSSAAADSGSYKLVAAATSGVVNFQCPHGKTDAKSFVQRYVCAHDPYHD